MKRVLKLRGMSNRKISSLEVFVGCNEDNIPTIVDFSKCNHLVMTGIDGAGRPRVLKSIIGDLVKKNTPEDLEVYIMQVGTDNLQDFDKSSHCKEYYTCFSNENICDSFEKMTGMVEALEKKAIRRRSLINGLSDELGAKNSDEISKKLPFVLLVVDDLSSLNNLFLNKEQNNLREACLKSLDEIISIGESVNIGVIQSESRLDNIEKYFEVENIYIRTIENRKNKVLPKLVARTAGERMREESLKLEGKFSKEPLKAESNPLPHLVVARAGEGMSKKVAIIETIKAISELLQEDLRSELD